jgi:hypothetical protein
MIHFDFNRYGDRDGYYDSLRSEIYNELLAPRQYCMFPILELATFLDNEFGSILNPPVSGLYLPFHIDPIIDNNPLKHYHYVKRASTGMDYGSYTTKYDPVIKTGVDHNGLLVYRVEDILVKPYVNRGSIYLNDRVVLSETHLNPSYCLKLLNEPNIPVQAIHFIKNYISEYIDKHTYTPYRIKYNPYSSYFINNEIPPNYEADIVDYIERTLSIIDSRLYDFINLDNKHIYTVEFKHNNTIVVGKSVDFRVLEYELAKIAQYDKS